MKVCGTCRYWSNKYKGYCERIHQGVGKFWICDSWVDPAAAAATATAAEVPEPQASKAKAVGGRGF